MFKLPSAQEWAICLTLAAAAALAGPSSAHAGTASGTITEAGSVGLNIKKSQVSKNVRLDTQSVRVSLTITNNGDVDEPAQAAVIGVQT